MHLSANAICSVVGFALNEAKIDAAAAISGRETTGGCMIEPIRAK